MNRLRLVASELIGGDDEDATSEPVQSLGRAPLYQCRDDAKVIDVRHGADTAAARSRSAPLYPQPGRSGTIT